MPIEIGKKLADGIGAETKGCHHPWYNVAVVKDTLIIYCTRCLQVVAIGKRQQSLIVPTDPIIIKGDSHV